jgi:uncharacterized Fe-S cluster protein YjdI
MEKKINYTNGEVTVVWRPDDCIHSRICWEKATGLPEVFNPQVKPWINMGGAGTDRIIAQVEKCPTHALSYFLNSGEASEKAEEHAEGVAAELVERETVPIVQIMKNGPLLVYGNITVKDQHGNETSRQNVTSFCRCGASKTNPYCDGTHFDIDFKG